MFVIEFGPVGIFFIAYYFSDFLTAALSLGVSTFVALILSRIVNKRVPWFAIFSGSLTILSALVTYLLTAPWVLIITDSVFYLMFALILGLSLWRNHSVFKTFFGHVFSITTKGWRVLEKRWFVLFVLACLSNEMVRVFLSPDAWVTYKQVVVVVFLVFGLYQFKVTIKHRLSQADRFGLRKFSPHNE
ncbi:MAG: intracellular septation protein [Candidatus Paceibacteria bacterium]|jgi:intracellular septation protein